MVLCECPRAAAMQQQKPDPLAGFYNKKPAKERINTEKKKQKSQKYEQ